MHAQLPRGVSALCGCGLGGGGLIRCAACPALHTDPPRCLSPPSLTAPPRPPCPHPRSPDGCNLLRLPADLAALLTQALQNDTFLCPNCLAGVHQVRGRGMGAANVEPGSNAFWGSAFSRPPLYSLPTNCATTMHRHASDTAFPAPLLQCYACKREGREGGDGSSEAEAVSKCIVASCGRYYHPRCIGAAEGEPFSW